MKVQIEKEKNYFIRFLKAADLETIRSTPKFWEENKDKYEHLHKTATILLNIPASSAFIERYFSVCGIISNNRCGNMSPDLLITRSLLQANIELLEDLSTERK
jgi:hypothetical protein